MSKTQVRRLLMGMSKEEVVEVVMGLYEARREAREYLDYYACPDEAGALARVKGVVRKEFDGQEGSRLPSCKFSVCRKALADFRRLAPSEEALAEALVFYVEQVYRLSFEAGDMWEQYYDSAVSNFRAMLRHVVKSNLLDMFAPRIKQILAWAWPCGYGFHEETDAVFRELVPQPYRSMVEEADALGQAQYYAIHPHLRPW